jgi:CheY-like chemotaxis protein
MTFMAKRILLVDDSRATRMALGQLLDEEGFDVRACASGPEALACLQAAPFEALVTDYEMPEMTGVELIRAVRERAPGVRAIVVSGRAAPEDVPQGVPWMDKPVALERLVAALRA